MKEIPTELNPMFVNGVECEACKGINYKMWFNKSETEFEDKPDMVMQCLACGNKKTYPKVTIDFVKLN